MPSQPRPFTLSNVTISNTAASVPENAIPALVECAKAAAENARAIQDNADAIEKIASALAGAPANMDRGISIGSDALREKP